MQGQCQTGQAVVVGSMVSLEASMFFSKFITKRSSIVLKSLAGSNFFVTIAVFDPVLAFPWTF